MAGSESVRVLGVDPGTRIAGYGVVDVAARRQVDLVDCGALHLASDSLPARLHALFDRIGDIVAAHAPAVLAIEDVFHGKNLQSAFKLGQARGVVIVAAQIAGMDVFEYAPRLVKKAITGNGGAGKDQVQRMIGRILSRDDLPESEDVSDALAVAVCHGQRMWGPSLGTGARRPAVSAKRRTKLIDQRSPAGPTIGQPLLDRLVREGRAVETTRPRRPTSPEKPPPA